MVEHSQQPQKQIQGHMKPPPKLLLLVSIITLHGLTAAPITTLFSTGVDASGTPLPNGTVGDPHYTLISVPGGSTALQVMTAAGGFPIEGGLWMGDNGLSAWVGPNNPDNRSRSAVGEVGIFIYRTTFDLTGMNPATAVVNGLVASDNWLENVVINGVPLGITAGFENFRYFTPFTISGGFVTDLNLLDFVVRNGSGPTGLRVQMTGVADPRAVAEGGTTFAMLIAAFSGLLALRRRFALG